MSKRPCHNWLGTLYGGNVKCPNSDSCCETVEQCRPDRLCSAKDDSDVIIRALCSNYPWTLSTCAQVCLYDNPTYFLPRINICADGSYCCDNDPTCCVDKQGFFLDNDGVITARGDDMPITTTPIQTASIPPSSVGPSITAEPSQRSTDNETPSGLSIPAKVGLGVGISLGALLTLCLGIFWFVRHRRRVWRGKEEKQAPCFISKEGFELDGTGFPATEPAELHSQPSQQMAELADNGHWQTNRGR